MITPTLILPHQGGGEFFRELDAPQLSCGVHHSNGEFLRDLSTPGSFPASSWSPLPIEIDWPLPARADPGAFLYQALDHPAVHVDGLASDEFRPIRRQESYQVRDILGITVMSQGNVLLSEPFHDLRG